MKVGEIMRKHPAVTFFVAVLLVWLLTGIVQFRATLYLPPICDLVHISCTHGYTTLFLSWDGGYGGEKVTSISADWDFFLIYELPMPLARLTSEYAHTVSPFAFQYGPYGDILTIAFPLWSIILLIAAIGLLWHRIRNKDFENCEEAEQEL